MRELYTAAFDTATMERVLTDVARVWGEADTLLDIDTVIGAVEELMDNAVEHSGNSGGQVTVLRDNFQVAAIVEDGGCGIHANMQAESEGRSVELAFQPGSTSTGAGQRGGGLWLVLTATAIVPDLTVHLHTGRTSYTASNGHGRLTANGTFHQGVLAELSAPLSDT